MFGPLFGGLSEARTGRTCARGVEPRSIRQIFPVSLMKVAVTSLDKLFLPGGFSEHFGLRYCNSPTGLHNAAAWFYRISIS